MYDRIWRVLFPALLAVTSVGQAGEAETLNPALGEAQRVSAAADVRFAPGELALDDEASRVAVDERTVYRVVNIEFHDQQGCEEFRHPQATLITRYENFADVFIPDDGEIFQEIAELEQVAWAETDRRGIIPPPVRPVLTRESTRQIPERIVRGGFGGLTGRGVILAVLDTGIDFRHPDFITYDADGRPTSRVRYYWDAASDAYADGIGQPAPVGYPNGAPIGTIYSRDDLTRDLRGDARPIPVSDLEGHGTACAGIAAGSGQGHSDYTGVAPGADIVAVRIASGSDGHMDLAFLAGAICEWLDRIAGDRPLVVSCSWGGQYGGRDGYLVKERQLSARFAPDRAGRALCFSAGNEGEDPLHAGMILQGDDRPSLISWHAPAGGEVDIYVQADDSHDLYLGPLGATQFTGVDSYVHGLSRNVVITVRFGRGDGGLYLYSRSGNQYLANAYIYGPPATVFSHDCFSLEKLVGAPGTTTNAITVGSYDWNDQFHYQGEVVYVPDFGRGVPLRIGALSSYSSPGPQRMGEVFKPDIAAPGQWHTAPAPADVPLTRDTSGLYRIFNGTSAATPYVAGVIALLLEKHPGMTSGDIRRALQAAASQDPLTGRVPNAAWGHGKLNLAAVARLLGDSE